MSLLDASSLAGLFALVVITFNFLLGLLLSTAYKRSPVWKKLPQTVRKIDVNGVHNWTAYVALILILIHPILLIVDKETKFKLHHILIPFNAPQQQTIVAFGVIAFYAIIVVIITTQKSIKQKMGFRTWKNVHLISYGTALLVCLHGILIDQNLKGNTPDFLDGEKVLCEICLLVLILASAIRTWYHFRKV